MVLLRAENIKKQFGGLLAVNAISFDINAGEILALIGPNGAGKTTVFNLITGIYAPDSGRILFKETPLNGRAVEKIALMGITRTFQNLQIFGNMSVAENVMAGAHRHGKMNLLQAGLKWPGIKKEEKDILKRAIKCLEMVGLADKAALPAGILPYGEQRLLEIARAMAVEPELILLDEPAAGLNDAETEKLGELILKLPKLGMTVFLVEHNMEMVMSVADRIVVIDYGAMLKSGTPAEIRNDERVIAAYLGEEA